MHARNERQIDEAGILNYASMYLSVDEYLWKPLAFGYIPFHGLVAFSMPRIEMRMWGGKADRVEK